MPKKGRRLDRNKQKYNKNSTLPPRSSTDRPMTPQTMDIKDRHACLLEGSRPAEQKHDQADKEHRRQGHRHPERRKRARTPIALAVEAFIPRQPAEPFRANSAERPDVAGLAVSVVLKKVFRGEGFGRGDDASPSFAGVGAQARLNNGAVHVAPPVALVSEEDVFLGGRGGGNG